MRKYGISCLVLTAGMCQAAPEFFTGMAARAIIGQRTFTDQRADSTDEIIGGVSGVAFGNNTLILVDDNRVSASPQNNRVLIFRNVNQFVPRPTDELPVGDVRCPLCIGKASVVLGQPDFKKTDLGVSERNFNRPTGVATDGRILAVCDTDNNRVLIWNSIPSSINEPANVVIGQPDFKTRTANEGKQGPTQRSVSGPQGVWIQGNRLFVADTLNNRVLIWRNIPTQNYQNADVVIGQPDFTTFQGREIRTPEPTPENMLQPVSVTSDGLKMFVADLGHNRVTIWNSIPDRNGASADVVVGQPDFKSLTSNNTHNLCPEERDKNDKNEDVFPAVCKASMDFPRYALSDGKRLFIADGGNDRVLVYNQIPTQNGLGSDIILGQIASRLNQVSDSANPLGQGSSDSVATPMGLAWDGTNLYVSDPFRRRVLIFTPGEPLVPYTGVRNLFSQFVYAVGTVTFTGNPKENDEVTLKIGKEVKDGDKVISSPREYKYKAKKDEKFDKIINALVLAVNSSNGGKGDQEALASPNTTFNSIILTARLEGAGGNAVEFSISTSTPSEISTTTSGATLSGGQDAAKIAPGTLVKIVPSPSSSKPLADATASAPTNADPLPDELAGVQVYFDGRRAPLSFVSPDEIRAQVPFDFYDVNSASAFLRIKRRDGTVEATAAVAVPIIRQNPGILADVGEDPRPGVITHFSSNATATVSVDGTAKENDIATIIINGREYSYTVKKDDTLASIVDGLIALINANPDEQVEAYAAGVFTRIRFRAKVAGPDGNGIAIATRVNDGGQAILTATNSGTCCANTAGARITEANPAIPGETIVVLATGLGLVNPREAQLAVATGYRYKGELINRPDEFVSSLAGGKTANVLFAGLAQGLIGIYEVHLELNSDLPTNPQTQVTIAQDIYVSNIVTFPVKNPKDDEPPPVTNRP